MQSEQMGLYSMAGVVRTEAFLNSQLQLVGGAQPRLLENLQKHKNSMKHQALLVKIIYGILVGLLPSVPVIMFFQLSGIPLVPETLTFVSVTLLIIYLGITPLYVIILGVNSTSGFMSGEVFEWLELLPISRSKLQKVEFLVLWRFFDIPLIIIVVVFPSLMAWVTGSIAVFFTCFAVSVLNAIFLFCILIFITEKFHRIMKGSGTNSRKASVLRGLAMGSYAITASSVSLIINLAIQAIQPMIESLATMGNVGLTNIVLSLIPFPFAPAYLVTFFLFPMEQISLPLLGSTLIGISLLVLLTWRLYRVVLGKLRNLTSHQARVEPLAIQKSSESGGIFVIKTLSPVKALLRKDLASLTRDLQGILFLIIPLVFPFVIFLQVQGPQRSFSWLGNDVYVYNFVLIFLIILTLLDAIMLVSGVLNIEDSGASISASLPVIPRDQINAKLKIIIPIQLVASLLPVIPFMGQPGSAQLTSLFLAYCPLAMTIVLLTFVTKIRLFGKIHYKYVVEEVNPDRKSWKWMIIIGLDGIILLGLFLLFFFLGGVITPMGIVEILATSGILGVFLVSWVINRTCPK